MKRLIFILACTGFFITGSKAQNPHTGHVRCATVEHKKQQILDDPSLADSYEKAEMEIQKWIAENINNLEQNREIITIPVVVHIVYKTAAQNISDNQVFSQIAVLNEDYRKKNADTNLIPAIFKNLSADVQVQFCLAQRTPDNNWTNGIERRQTTLTSFTQSSNAVKSYSKGGLDAWDASRYLNIWVCNLSGGLLGYAQMPNGPASTDGVVIQYDAFGRYGSAAAPYNKGRSATHEIGHWLSLYHVWGDDGGLCYGPPDYGSSDLVNDTPDQADENYGCPSFPNPSCNNTSDMFMNYMDYVDDGCMQMFTLGQKARMWGVLNTVRASLKTSNACTPAGIEDFGNLYRADVYPNPTNSQIKVDVFLSENDPVTVEIVNLLGKTLYSTSFHGYSNYSETIDVSGFSSGIYFVKVSSSKASISKKLIIE